MSDQKAGININMNQENEIRNAGKKGLELYKKFCTLKLPVANFRVSANTSDNVFPEMKKNRSNIMFKFNITNTDQAEDIKKKITDLNIKINAAKIDINILYLSIDSKNVA